MGNRFQCFTISLSAIPNMFSVYFLVRIVCYWIYSLKCRITSMAILAYVLLRMSWHSLKREELSPLLSCLNGKARCSEAKHCSQLNRCSTPEPMLLLLCWESEVTVQRAMSTPRFCLFIIGRPGGLAAASSKGTRDERADGQVSAQERCPPGNWR